MAATRRPRSAAAAHTRFSSWGTTGGDPLADGNGRDCARVRSATGCRHGAGDHDDRHTREPTGPGSEGYLPRPGRAVPVIERHARLPALAGRAQCLDEPAETRRTEPGAAARRHARHAEDASADERPRGTEAARR